jgi:uncharacterized protein (TIGR00645 family)
MLKKGLGHVIFTSRWLLYPINIGLLAMLTVYVGTFLYDDYHFIRSFEPNLESLMVMMLGFVDASMVANLIIMIVQGSHQIFLQKFELTEHSAIPQYLDHMDSGIMKVKVALSIASITLVQLLKDFVNIEHVDWSVIVHRMTMHGAVLVSATMTALIWRITHPQTRLSNGH